jgi:hypothetical protein
MHALHFGTRGKARHEHYENLHLDGVFPGEYHKHATHDDPHHTNESVPRLYQETKSHYSVQLALLIASFSW